MSNKSNVTSEVETATSTMERKETSSKLLLPIPMNEAPGNIQAIAEIPVKDRTESQRKAWQDFSDENSRRENAIKAHNMKAFSRIVSRLQPDENGKIDLATGLGVKLVQAVTGDLNKTSKNKKFADAKGSTGNELGIVLEHLSSNESILQDAVDIAKELIEASRGLNKTSMVQTAATILGYNPSKGSAMAEAVNQCFKYAQANK